MAEAIPQMIVANTNEEANGEQIRVPYCNCKVIPYRQQRPDMVGKPGSEPAPESRRITSTLRLAPL